MPGIGRGTASTRARDSTCLFRGGDEPLSHALLSRVPQCSGTPDIRIDHRVRPFQRAFQLFRSEKGKQGCIAYDIRPRGTRYPGFRDSASSACTLKLELHRYFETFRSFMQWKVGVSFSTEHRLLRFQDAPPVFFHTVPGTLIRVCHVSLLAPRD